MRGLKSFEYEISNTKYSLPFAFFNRTLNFDTEPTNIISNQTLLTKLAFADQNTKQTVKHVTVRMEISESASDRRLLSEFFHAHDGNINIEFRPTAGLIYVVTGNMDDLTNAWVADPASPIIVN